MKRDQALRPLSREHHVLLELALRMRRATHGDVRFVCGAFRTFWKNEGERHLQAEEQVLLPAFARRVDARSAIVLDVLGDHVEMRMRAGRLLDQGAPDLGEVQALGSLLTTHVRREERELFPLLEATLTSAELECLGHELQRFAETNRVPGPTSSRRDGAHDQDAPGQPARASASSIGSGDRRSVLVAFDRSTDAEAAVRAAVRFASDGELTVLTVWAPEQDDDETGASGAAGACHSDEGTARARATVGARLANASGAAAVPRVERVALGVAETISAVAEDLEAGLVVLGRHGREGDGYGRLGPTAHRVLEGTRRPVLVIAGADVPHDGARRQDRERVAAHAGGGDSAPSRDNGGRIGGAPAQREAMER